MQPLDMRLERLFQESHFRAYKVSRILNFRKKHAYVSQKTGCFVD